MSSDPARVGRSPQRPLLNDLLITSVVVSTLRHVLWVRAGAVNAGASAVTEDLAQRAALLSGYSAYAEEELPAVQGVSVLGEGSLCSALGAHELLVLVDDDGVTGAVRDLADPQAAVGDLVVRQTWGALVPVSFPVLALPEDSAVLRVSECPPESGTVGGGDGRLQLSPLPALHQVQLLALLQLVALVSVDEGEAIAAGPQLRQAVRTGPVLVTAVQVRVETFQLVRTREIVHIVQAVLGLAGDCC